MLALALRLLLWSQPLHQLANDEIEYVAVARDLLAGRGWQFYDHYHWLRAPLYPLFLAGSLWLAGGDLHRAALPNIALSVATVYLSYRLALKLVGRRAAELAALLTALLWTHATFASLYMSETLFTFLFTAALMCLVREPRTENQEPGIDLRFGAWTSIIGGICFGLATLTRSITLLFFPIVILWLLFGKPRIKSREIFFESAGLQRLVLGSWFSVLSFVLATVLVIAPWTIHNERAYGRPILVETGLSYNLWAFNEPREDQETIFRTLENIPNPAERSDYAMAKGLARLREDPTILLRRIWPNWIYLWRVKPIEDRFILENYYADIGLPLFSAALIFDDALYLLIALAGIAGLALYRPTTDDRPRPEPGRRRPTTDDHAPTPVKRALRGRRLRETLGDALLSPKWLLIAWLLYVLATVLLTHGEARYRHFLFPALIPYAAWTLARRPKTKDQRPNNQELPGKGQPATDNGQHHHLVILSSCHLVVLVLWLLVGGTALTQYPWRWAEQNLARGWHALLADVALAAGNRDRAQIENQRALAAQETIDGWLRIGDMARASGEIDRARSNYRAAVRLSPTYVPAVARLADLLRAGGDAQAARDTFDAAYINQQWLADWSWRELRAAPPDALDVGDGLDYGYVGGVYLTEEQQGATARWTNGRGMLRLRRRELGRATPTLVRLRLAAPRPDGAPARVQICAAGRCAPIDVGPGWRTYLVPLDASPDGSLLVEIRSDTFEAGDGRRLGVLIDWASVTTDISP
jgi:hypothetical protein